MLLYVVKYGPGPLDPPIFNRLDQCQWGKLKAPRHGGHLRHERPEPEPQEGRARLCFVFFCWWGRIHALSCMAPVKQTILHVASCAPVWSRHPPILHDLWALVA